MIIDAHAHLYAPDSLYAYRAHLLADGGYHRLRPNVSERSLEKFVAKNIEFMDSVGTDLQLLSPRPYHAASSIEPARLLEPWTRANNDVIARVVEMRPNRFVGIAGVPLAAGAPVESCFAEIDRAVNELGFVGLMVNPDPAEGQRSGPPLGDEYWFPLFEKMIELEVPALIHSAGCFNERETYSEHFVTEESIAILSLLRGGVLDRFPELRLVIAHGGGSVPYQIGRWEAERAHATLSGKAEPFRDSLRRLWFDTVLHNPASLELLVRTVGADRCLFGTERPGSGTAPNAETGRDFDDIRPVIDEMAGLSADDRAAIFEGNVRALYPRLDKRLASVGTATA